MKAESTLTREDKFKGVESKTDKKLRGGYYTPKEIATFIARWVIRKQSRRVLEPSCGDGIFVDVTIERASKLQLFKKAPATSITGIELNPVEARKAAARFSQPHLKHQGNIQNADFFGQCKKWLTSGTKFDSIVGNPPFIRYQDFPEEYRSHALDLMDAAGLKQNRLMNAWMPFVVGSTLILESGGRIGFVLPAELFQVGYAAQLRKFLSESYSKVIVVTFRKLVFADIQQEVVLFLGEKNGRSSHGINIIEVDDITSLKEVDLENIADKLKVLESSTEKWTQYFLDENEVELIRRLRRNPNIPRTGDYLEVDVGVVTGQNAFFVLNASQVKQYNLSRYTGEIFSKAVQLKGTIARQADWEEAASNDYANYLLRAPDVEFDRLPATVKNYIGVGEQEGHHTGYKCRIRKRWWVVPTTWIPDAFMLRQVNGYPKLILNECSATSTDTIHRVRFLQGVNGREVTAAYLNSLTLAFSEITGRSYGGGVLTFEPSEAEQLPISLRGAHKLNINQIDQLIRQNEIEKVLDITDKVLLVEGLGLSKTDVKALRGIWKKLRDRRLNRRR